MSSFHLNSELEQLITTLQNKGKTVIVVGTNQEILAVIAVADQVRESAKGSFKSCINLAFKDDYVNR